MFSIPMEAQNMGRFIYESHEVNNEYGTDRVKTNDDGEAEYTVICRYMPPEATQAETVRVKIYLPGNPNIEPYTPIVFDGLALTCWEKGRSLGASFRADGIKSAVKKNKEAQRQQG